VQAFPLINHPNISAAVIAANFNLKTKRHRKGRSGKYAQGRVYPAILDQLEQVTINVRHNHEYHRTEALAIIWALHFPPKYPSLSRTMQLIDSHDLIRRANQCATNALLAGHTHEPVRYSTPDMKFDVFCAGTASQYFAPHGNHFQIVNVDVDDRG